MNVLVLNAGSSTLKFQLIATDHELMRRDGDVRLCHGVVDRIGSLAILTFKLQDGRRVVLQEPVRDHQAAIDRVLRWLLSPEAAIPVLRSLADIHAVGHRVVHGGQRFRASVLIDAEVLAGIEDHVELAPLHNPANLKGIRAVQELLGTALPQAAVFDTAFHASMPEAAYIYAIPYHYYRRFQIRRYGFHGTSHRYIAYRYRKLKGIEKARVHVITLHLGNGCSACAIRGGVSVDTSMGFTPLEGLVMGTRSGDLDPSILDYLGYKEGLSPSEVESVLNKQSGLLGLSGMTSDMRELLAEEAEHADRRVVLALEVFCKRVRKYIGAYFADMGGADAVIFSGGVGENSPQIRARICRGLESIGLELDEQANARLTGEAGVISRPGSRLEARVIPTDEELLIARDTLRLVSPAP